MTIIKYKKWYKYKPEVEQYCKKECPKCWIDEETGRAFCYGKWEDEDKYTYSDGNDCSITIDYCLTHKQNF